ncbi:tryptophan synthase subunit alpha [Nocardioides sp.]|uniref:tryptophan synthase subunit alpha n=1 Tax=Nocardioides sp. TaxID=35761 RepID=UPI0035117994
MSGLRVASAFETARAEGRSALVGYLPAAFPDVEWSIAALRTMVDAGCDVIEVGLPYSDPVMDGPVIQRAVQHALDGGFRVDDLFRVVEAVAATGTPTLVMTSWNPVERRGVDRFAQQLDDAGGAGLITPDVIPEFAGEWSEAADARDLDKVFLVAPSSTDERIASTTAHCRGFVYATGIMGVTGTTQATAEGVAPLIARTKATTDLPVGVGVGVSTGVQAAAMSEHADGIIVGTAFVRTLLDHADDRDAALSALRSLTEELAGGVRRA